MFELGISVVEEPVQATVDERPYFPVACFILSRNTGLLIGQTLCKFDQLEEVQFLLADTISTIGCRPRKIIYQSHLAFNAVFPITDQLNIPLKKRKETSSRKSDTRCFSSKHIKIIQVRHASSSLHAFF